jgi:2-oxoglutarate dehydrogenase E1 component
LNPDIHNLDFAEQLYAEFRRRPASVSPEWQKLFATLPPETAVAAVSDAVSLVDSRMGPGPSGGDAAERSVRPGVGTGTEEDNVPASVRERLHELIRNFRERGHYRAALDPLGGRRPARPELEPEYYQFSGRELELVTCCATLPYDAPLTVREIIQRLENTYCRSIGAQFMHLDDPVQRHWLQRRMEATQNHLALSPVLQRFIFSRLSDAFLLDEFLRKQFVGAKTFSLEGSESLIPLLALALNHAGGEGIREVVLGMAHRGRLNVLANILGKSPCQIFRDFADTEPEQWMGRGDVKYHLGHSGSWQTIRGETLHLSLCFNPSHLEYVNPIVLGRVRARQDRLGDGERRQVLGILMHGDAAFIGEGVVQESLNLTHLSGYRTGGTLHLVLNNQIGFTTGPEEGRSTDYATDVLKMAAVPIFHVNGEDPEAVAQAVQLAMDFRREFQTDVCIDLYGYRRWGHNETDDPSLTQPVLYRAIGQRAGVSESYRARLLEKGGMTAKEADEITNTRRAALEKDLAESRCDGCVSDATPTTVWRDYHGGPEPAAEEPLSAEFDVAQLAAWLRTVSSAPEGFQVHPRLQKVLDGRRAMADGQRPLDWGAAEALALASLAARGVRIRLTGQDSRRGTFSHRHGVFYDYENGTPYLPLSAIGGTKVEIWNSPLCETGSLGFEYGYSLSCPDGLVIWEAQFGDFVNAGQVIIDQFITSGEDKWNRLSGVVLLLPHGFEGLGPEHSSARPERFLQMAAEDNVQIVQPSLPAQYFHVLRRQMLRRWRKPLVILTPKSLLRHPQCVSSLEDCVQRRFEPILPEATRVEPGGVRRVLLCSGKIYYDLVAYREERQHRDVAIIRLEQFYPWKGEALRSCLQQYLHQPPVFWVQEEPINMGAWHWLHERLGRRLFDQFAFAAIARPESASPATGSARAHKLEQASLLARAFGDAELASGGEKPPLPVEAREPESPENSPAQPSQNQEVA